MMRAALAGAAGGLLLPACAGAHVQVSPARVAPGDAVRFEVLVPNERDRSTVEVKLRIPPGVLPFSFEQAPGWRRSTELARDGVVDTVTWRGRLARDGFARFSFLASTPDREGELVWKALQTYEDHVVSRWIGPPDAEEPAAVTTVSRGVATRNAGGEDDAAPAPSSPTTSAVTDGDDGDDGGRDALTLGLAVGGLLLGAAALAIALRRRAGL